MSEKVFLNDGLVDMADARVSVADAGFLYGAGLFETMRANNGVVFAIEDHLDRLFFSAHKLAIKNTYDKQYIHDAVYKVLEAKGLKNARLRLTLTGGKVTPEESEQKSTLLVTAAELAGYPAAYYEKGVVVALCPYRQNPFDPTCGHKVLSYFPRMLGLEFARKFRCAEALWFTNDNRLAEGCISNVFLVKDSVLYTPPIQTPVLAGVARKTIFEIALNGAVEVVEKDLYISDVLEADEVFLTNVIMQVMPINRVEKHAVGSGEVGPMTRRLAKEFDDYLRRQCTKAK